MTAPDEDMKRAFEDSINSQLRLSFSALPNSSYSRLWSSSNLS